MSEQQDVAKEPSNPPEPAQDVTEHPPVYSPDPSLMAALSPNSFVIEDSFYRSRTPSPVHWSVAWSDLMMTMFILFLSMFVYQASHEEFLIDHTPEIIGGSTTDAIDILNDDNIIVPIVPLAPKKPAIGSSLAKNVEERIVEDLTIDTIFNDRVVFVEPVPTPDTGITETAKLQEPDNITNNSSDIASMQADLKEPAPVEIVSNPREKQADTFNDMYDMSRQKLKDEKLGKFASIEVVPDKTMRIILTGDLLFSTGQADLSSKARSSIKTLAAVIRDTPYMINVIGHTDNLPMHSSRFTTNWELSVIRASSVARFLIEEMEMDPKQFIVSGYGSNRPRRPNTNVINRAANRRVEIIISKRLAPAVRVTAKNLL